MHEKKNISKVKPYPRKELGLSVRNIFLSTPNAKQNQHAPNLTPKKRVVGCARVYTTQCNINLQYFI